VAEINNQWKQVGRPAPTGGWRIVFYMRLHKAAGALILLIAGQGCILGEIV
jgi:hypothetical protein